MTLGKSNVKAVNANTVEKLSCGCQTVSSQHKNTCTPVRIPAHSTRLTTPEDVLSSSMGAHVARIAATMLTQVIQIAVMCSVTKFRMGLLPCDKRRHTASPTTNKTITAESRSTRFMDKRSTGDQDSISLGSQTGYLGSQYFLVPYCYLELDDHQSLKSQQSDLRNYCLAATLYGKGLGNADRHKWSLLNPRRGLFGYDRLHRNDSIREYHS